MASTAAVLNILVTANTAQATTGLARTNAQLKTTAATAGTATAATTKASAGMRALGTAAKFGGAAIVAGLAVGLKKAVDEAREAQKATAQTRAVIKSMGNQAGVTAKEVEKLANKISTYAGVDDEAIQSAENLLLTFKNLRNEAGKGNDIFDQTALVVDMSAALGQDLKASSIQLGKALNDPSVGLTALRRVGVSFNETQTEMIKKIFESGNQMKAQKIILKELNAEFAGSAKAQADPWDKLNVALENLAESVGTSLLPTFSRWANVVAKFLHQMNTGKKAGGDFSKALKVVGDIISKILWPATVLIYKQLYKMGKALVDIGKWGVKAFNSVKNAAMDVWDWIKGAWQNIGDWLSDPFRNGANAIIGFINLIIDAINALPGIPGEIGHVASIGGGGPSTQKQQAKKRGGGRQLGGLASIVPGYGSGDKVHMQAMVEPGEGIFVMNRNAMGALEAMNQNVPRRARGGSIPHMDIGGFLGDTPIGKVIGGAGDLISKLPSPSDLPDWIQGTGTYIIDKAKDYIQDKIGSLFAGGGGPDQGFVGGTWDRARLLANKFGLTISSSYRSPAANAGAGGVPGSLHTHGSPSNPGAFDFVPPKQAALAFAVGKWHPEEAMIHDAGSGLHLHLGFFKGGGALPRTPQLGNKWITKTAGSRWDADEAFTLLRQVGASREVAKKLSAKVMGESSGIPNNIGHDPGGTTGYGLWQITTGYNDDIIRKYGGARGVMRPVANAMAALDVYRRGGIGQWYAPSGRAGSLLWDRINVPEKKSKKPKKPGKKKPGKGGGGAADDLLASQADRLASINELIGGENLLKLQNYNLGMAQHPLLGIPNPAAPALAPLLSSLPGAETMMTVGARKDSVHSPQIGGPKMKQRLVGGPVILIEDGAVNANRIRSLSGREAKRAMKRAARRGNRRLPSGGGGGP